MSRPRLDAPDTLTDGAWRAVDGVQRWVAAGMSNVDGCPECVTNTEPPRSCVRVDDAWRCGYLCSDCGHAWTTDWKD